MTDILGLILIAFGAALGFIALLKFIGIELSYRRRHRNLRYRTFETHDTRKDK